MSLCHAAEHKPNPHRGLASTQPQGDVPAKFALHCFSPGHDDLFSCCQSKNFRGASYTYFAVHITGALVLFMTDGIVVSSADRGIFSERSSVAFFLPNHLEQPTKLMAVRLISALLLGRVLWLLLCSGLCVVAAEVLLTQPVQGGDGVCWYAVQVSSQVSQEARTASS